MRITNIKNPSRFFDKVAQCKGSVELVTSEGDRLNLKSTLCQYLALTQMFDEAKLDMQLVLSEPGEMEMLQEYIVCD
ncbi:MAG: polya polymerase [Bacillota bacterium]